MQRIVELFNGDFSIPNANGGRRRLREGVS